MRGSGRFEIECFRHSRSRSRFNPLHCGAVVASRLYLLLGQRLFVSIPFIAGQWSLQHCVFGDWTWTGEVSIPFIAGQWSLPPHKEEEAMGIGRVSIPFIAGQWSLPARLGSELSETRVFQSPSLRGSGRFFPSSRRWRSSPPRFNPLHCGAVVASGKTYFPGSNTLKFRSPSLRGSGRFALYGVAQMTDEQLFQSPSLRGSGRFPGGGSWWLTSRGFCFNPLHCGAVVASRRLENQLETLARLFQSPSLRGSGRFLSARRR